MKAAQSQAQAGPSALGELCRLYWYPLYIFARRRGHSADDAEDKEFVRLDAEEAEDRYQLEPVESLTAEKIFNARWAMTVLGEALKVFLDPNNAITPPSYDEVANRIQVTTGAVKTLIHRLRKRYTGLLREAVGRTVSDPSKIDEEIHALCDALVASEGRLSP
jgi:hypothetical protein